MRWKQNELTGSKQTNTSANYSYLDYIQKPIEVYIFIDPLCAECWSLEPYLKKLSVEYGRFFTVRQVISGQISSINNLRQEKQKQMKQTWEKTAALTGMSCDGDFWEENPIASPLLPALAIKAAELQGKRAGKVFLRKLQEHLFLNKKNIAEEDVLMDCAKEANLDLEEFENDLHSATAENALQCDIRLLREMEVDQTPSIVFINQNSDEEGIKVSGLYPYEIYEMILKEVLERSPIPSSKPSLEEFLQQYEVVGTKEVSVVYDWPETKTEKELKKLQIQQLVKRIPAKHGTFWKYNFQ